jgi:RNase P/RNase MRP subunit p29
MASSFALQFRRGTTSQHSTFTGLQGEITVDTTKKTLVVHDGTTAGGIPLAKETASTEAGFNPFLLIGA